MSFYILYYRNLSSLICVFDNSGVNVQRQFVHFLYHQCFHCEIHFSCFFPPFLIRQVLILLALLSFLCSSRIWSSLSPFSTYMNLYFFFSFHTFDLFRVLNHLHTQHFYIYFFMVNKCDAARELITVWTWFPFSYTYWSFVWNHFICSLKRFSSLLRWCLNAIFEVTNGANKFL